MSWNKNGEYVADLPRDPFEQQRTAFFTNVQQQIESDEYFPRDPLGQEDYMYSGLENLYEQGVITDTEAVGIYANWISKRRPDTVIVQVDQPRQYGKGYHNE